METSTYDGVEGVEGVESIWGERWEVKKGDDAYKVVQFLKRLGFQWIVLSDKELVGRGVGYSLPIDVDMGGVLSPGIARALRYNDCRFALLGKDFDDE